MSKVDKATEAVNEMQEQDVEEVETGESKTVGTTSRKGEDPLTSRGFSFSRLFKALIEQDWSKAKLEREISEKLKDEGYDTKEGGTLVPTNPEATYSVHENALSDFASDAREFGEFMNREYGKRVTTEDDNVGSLVEPEQADDFIDLLRNESVVEEAGARVLDLPKSGQLDIPKMKNGAKAYWIAENEAITASDINTGDLKLRPNYLGCLVKASKQSLRHATPSLEQMLREDMSREMALKEDKTFLYGSAASDGAASDIPTGILDNSNTYSKSLTISKDNLIDLEAFLTQVEPTAWLMNKAERGDILKVEDSNGNAVFLGDFAEGGAGPDQLLNVPVIVSEQIETNDMFLGDFRQGLIARDMVMEVTTTDQTADAFTKNQVWFKAMLGVDFGIRYGKAFLYNTSAA